MFILDSITIAVCAVLVLLAVASSFADVFCRKPKQRDVGGSAGDEPVSVVLVSENNSSELREYLPAYLAQDYPAGFEVIVVVCKDDDGTRDVLESFAGHENLYVTYVPDSSRYVSRRKLAVTLGVKAAKHERILLADASCRPDSRFWVSSMASLFGNGVEMVFGYSNYFASTYNFQRFNRFHREYAMMLDASAGRTYGMAGNNLMFSKDMFMRGDGFRDNLKYIRGEYSFILNRYASDSNVVVNLDPDSFLFEPAPTKKEWKENRLFYRETRRHLKRGFVHRLMPNLDMLSLNLCFWASVGCAVYAALFQWWLVLAFALFALIVPFVSRTLTARRAMIMFTENMNCCTAVPLELYTVWHNLKYAIRYKLSDKDMYICHKS